MSALTAIARHRCALPGDYAFDAYWHDVLMNSRHADADKLRGLVSEYLRVREELAALKANEARQMTLELAVHHD